jgi:dTMP kinase
VQPESPRLPHHGRRIAIEGVTGVGKTYLTDRASRHLGSDHFVFIEAFTERAERPDLGSQIVRALATAARSDPFLQAGHPGSETLLLLATQAHNYEASLDAVQDGRTVVEGRSLYSVAAYQAVLQCPGDIGTAHAEAHKILQVATDWRPLPDLVVLVDDHTHAALDRAENRDRRSFTPTERATHHQAAALYRLLITEDRGRIIDRRTTNPRTVVQQLTACLTSALDT